MAFVIDPHTWAEQQFSDCDFGDRRRTKRLIKVAQQVANDPSSSFPNQIENWSDLKAGYRLFAQDDVTFEAVATPHWLQTRQREPGRYLLIGDTTELDFGFHREIDGLGPTGNGGGRGFLLHNALLVHPETKEVLGLAGQTIHYRQHAPQKRESTAQRLKRRRESEIWGKLIDDMGPASQSVQFVHIYDRGADNFEVYCHLQQQRGDWVIRASSLHRKILTPEGKSKSLRKYLQELPVAGTYDLELRARPGQAARTAHLEVRFGAIRMPTPHFQSAYVKKLNPQPIPMYAVWVREVNAPQGVEPIEWVLYTSLPVKSFNDAWMVIEYYETRWVVEEFHKALKSGCQVTNRGLQTAGRLEPMVALMSIVAVRLLQLRSVARATPDRPARQIVPQLWLTMLKAARKKLQRVHDLTIYEFYREVAKLGGFLGRKCDGEPGWITIWRGWEKLTALVRGAEFALEAKRCG